MGDARRVPASTLCVITIVLYACGCLVADQWSGLHVDRNDFWGNVELARQARVGDPASLHNGFFPIAYTLLLEPFVGHPVLPALVVSAAFCALLLCAAWQIGRTRMGDAWTLAALLLIASDPMLFRYGTSPGPDIGVAALVTAGLATVLRALNPPPLVPGAAVPYSRWLPFAGGVLFGCAALLRYHGLVLGAGAIAGVLFEEWRARARLRSPRPPLRLSATASVPALAGFGATYGLQVLANLAGGFGPFETAQAFNVYKLVHGVDWYRVGAMSAPRSIWTVVAEAPAAFGAAYLRAFAAMLPWLVAPAVLAVSGVTAQLRQMGRITAVATAIYLAIAAAGSSSRADLPVRALGLLALVALMRSAVHALESRRPPNAGSARSHHGPRRPVQLVCWVLAAALGVHALIMLRQDYGLVKGRLAANRTYRGVEAALRADGVTSAREVFSSDFSLYLPTLAPFTPWTNGTWLKLDARYRAAHPDVCTASIACFVDSARAAGISHVVLTADARQLSDELGQAYDRGGTEGLEPVGGTAAFKIYRVGAP